MKDKAPIVTEQYADNGEFSHYHLIDVDTGDVLWSSFPEETIARGQKIKSTTNTILNHKDDVKVLENRMPGFYNVKIPSGDKVVYWDGNQWDIDFGIPIVEVYGLNNAVGS